MAEPEMVEVQVPYGPFVLEPGGPDGVWCAAGIVWTHSTIVGIRPMIQEAQHLGSDEPYHYLTAQIWSASEGHISLPSARASRMLRWDLSHPWKATETQPVTVLMQSLWHQRMTVRLWLGVMRERDFGWRVTSK